jgi:hypothetical protein
MAMQEQQGANILESIPEQFSFGHSHWEGFSIKLKVMQPEDFGY